MADNLIQERKQKKGSDRFELFNDFTRVQDIQEFFVKYCIQTNTSERSATTFWNLICVCLFMGGLIGNLKELQTYQTLCRNFRSSENGVPQPKMSARFVDSNKNTLEIKDKDKIPLQDDKWTKELEVAEIDVLQVQQ